MSALISRQNKYFKLIPAAYFMLLGLFILFTSLTSKYGFSKIEIILSVALAIPFLFRKLWVYLIAGICYGVVFSYCGIAWIVFLVRYLTGTPCRNPLLNFSAGFAAVAISIACSVWLIYQCIDHSGKNVHLKEKL